MNLRWVCVLVCAGLGALGAQESVPIFDPGERVEIVERYNYSVRTDGSYAGHVQRETRMLLLRRDAGPRYRGEFMTTENTLRDLRTVASRVTEREPVEIVLDSGVLGQVHGAPVTRGLPSVLGGGRGSWEAPAAIRFQLPRGQVVMIPVVVAYQLQGREMYEGQAVVRVAYGYRLRWPLSEVELEDHPARELVENSELPSPRLSLRGNRQGTLLIPAGIGVPVLHRTELNEQVQLPGGEAEQRRGFILTWYRGAIRGSAGGTGAQTAVEEASIPDVEIDRDPMNRLRLSLRNLRFVADQAVLLPGEGARLDALAQVLRESGAETILVTGHTAAVGTIESQQELSIERAQRITQELIDRGVPPGRLRYEGRGGREPVGDNGTEEGRARNRRVEIRLLSTAD